MKPIYKKLSVLLSIMMVLCMFTALPFSAGAATTGGTISVTSNVADTVTYDYDANTSQVTVTYALKANNKILDTQAYVTYDSSVLSLASSNTDTTCFPVLSGSSRTFANYDESGAVYFNSTNLSLFDFTSSKTFVTLTFDVVGSGDTTVNLNVEILTGTTASSYSDIYSGSASDIDYVNGDTVTSGFTMSASAKLTQSGTDDGVTIKFARPAASASADWPGGVYLYYSSTSNYYSTANKIEMTATSETYTVSSVGSLTKYTTGDWKVYSVTLTDDQIDAIDSATHVGFCSKGNVYIRTDYSTSVLSGYDSIADVSGKTFVIGNCSSTSSERTTLIGSWTGGSDAADEGTTVKFARPAASASADWPGGVYLYYSSTSNYYSTANKIEMTDTGETYTVSGVGSLTKYTAGDWKVYSVTLTADQVEAIDNATHVGFCSKGNVYIRTDYSTSVLSGYDSIADVSGETFVIGNCSSTSSERTTLVGSWTGGSEATGTTIEFACPTPTSNWPGGVYLYYTSDKCYSSSANKIEMTATGETYTVSSVGSLTKYTAGNWKIYSVTLTDEQVEAIDGATHVGFCSTKNVWIRTDFTTGVLGSYSSIADVSGKIFVITGCSGNNSERAALTGEWK